MSLDIKNINIEKDYIDKFKLKNIYKKNDENAGIGRFKYIQCSTYEKFRADLMAHKSNKKLFLLLCINNFIHCGIIQHINYEQFFIFKWPGEIEDYNSIRLGVISESKAFISYMDFVVDINKRTLIADKYGFK